MLHVVWIQQKTYARALEGSERVSSASMQLALMSLEDVFMNEVGMMRCWVMFYHLYTAKTQLFYSS